MKDKIKKPFFFIYGNLKNNLDSYKAKKQIKDKQNNLSMKEEEKDD